MIRFKLFVVFVSLLFVGCNREKVESSRPNILWITSEDNSPMLGCYGDSFATTPNLDKFAAEGFLYTNAYANAPVCAAARNTIISGVHAHTAGNQHMRSYNRKSDAVKFYPDFLREAGYYCTNNNKTDYNVDRSQTASLWDESSGKAHYKNREDGQPFFAVFNIGVSHESSIHNSIPTDQLRHDPDSVSLPPYHPNTLEMRHDWAQYYDKVEDMDTKVGKLLDELEELGEAENTIVFYYGDHGGVLARSKRYLYETGTRVPFIVRVPDRFKDLFPGLRPGESIDRMISFVDLAPTLLSLLDIPIPDYMQGDPFLGNLKTEKGPKYVHMFRGRMDERYDMCRAVKDEKFRYIRNYMPYRPNGQHLIYLWTAPSVRSWERAYLAGECNETQSRFWESRAPEELYDTDNDPWEVNNLALDPNYSDVLKRMREENIRWAKENYDSGFIPEGELLSLTSESAPYDLIRSSDCDLNSIIDAAELATRGGDNLIQSIDLLKSDNGSIRYWGATGLLILGDKAECAIPELTKALDDSSPNVAVVAAEALYKLGKRKIALKAILKALDNDMPAVRCHAMNVIDCLNIDDKEVQKSVQSIVESSKSEDAKRIDIRMTTWLSKKWKEK